MVMLRRAMRSASPCAAYAMARLFSFDAATHKRSAHDASARCGKCVIHIAADDGAAAT